ncbi:antennal-specific protein OS-C isoform X1 [Drosophila bipectinata]|uniref:antennal-specific protein OS-C isoform X1 n=1 Tax=Drosophila bipectinata TaxID=42026 RepID=UPI0007E60904|nr:antennal-specific protein OS-C isoform X1 [Drosophila bipectinata]
MGFHVGRQLLLAGFLLVLLEFAPRSEARPQEVITVVKEETEVIKQEGDGDDDDDSSSEETVEDSGENRRRRREVNTDSTLSARAGIPGEQIVPILVDAVLPSAVADRLSRSAEADQEGPTTTEKTE